MYDVVELRKGLRTQTAPSVTSGAATQIAAKNPSRKSITIQNQGSVTIFLGASNVSATGATTGYALFAGLTLTDTASTDEWWAISASTTTTLSVIEVT
jgi:hypothetical protein